MFDAAAMVKSQSNSSCEFLSLLKDTGSDPLPFPIRCALLFQCIFIDIYIFCSHIIFMRYLRYHTCLETSSFL